MLVAQSYRYPNLSEGANSVGGHLRGDKERPVWRNRMWQRLEKGAGKRCSDCGLTQVKRAGQDKVFTITLEPAHAGL